MARVNILESYAVVSHSFPAVIDGQTIPKLTPTQVQNPPEVVVSPSVFAFQTRRLPGKQMRERFTP